MPSFTPAVFSCGAASEEADDSAPALADLSSEEADVSPAAVVSAVPADVLSSVAIPFSFTLLVSVAGAVFPADELSAFLIGEEVSAKMMIRTIMITAAASSIYLRLSDTHLYKQFGNSVSVNVIQAIAGQIKGVLES